MSQVVFFFLLFACVFSGTITLSFKGAKNSDGLIRVPLTRSRRAADGLTSVKMKDNRNNHYALPLEIGTPPQKFDLVLDTGSGDLTVAWKKPEVGCSGEICGSTAFFDDKKSSTVQVTSEEYFEGFQSTSNNLTKALDTVTIGGLTIKNQPIGLAYAGWLIDDKYHGIIGISYSSLVDGRTTILDHLKEQKQIDKQVFCTKLRPEEKGESEFILGGCDVEPVGGWQPVMKINGEYTGWRLKMTKLIIRSTKDNSVLYSAEPNHETVLDSGAESSLGIPSKWFKGGVADALGVTTYQGAVHNNVDCADRVNLPNIELYFGDAKVVIPYEVYSWPYNGECQVGLYDNKDGSFFSGLLLFNSATVIFDKDNNQIGFAGLD